MSRYAAGSIWSIKGLPDAFAIIIAGPFEAAPGLREYVIAPLYSPDSNGFQPTELDVVLTAEETPFGEARFAALWNSRPVAESDLVLFAGKAPSAAAEALRDVYFASVEDNQLPHLERRGQPVRWYQRSVRSFQSRELAKWQVLSGRLLQALDPALRNRDEDNAHAWSTIRRLFVCFASTESPTIGPVEFFHYQTVSPELFAAEAILSPPPEGRIQGNWVTYHFQYLQTNPMPVPTLHDPFFERQASVSARLNLEQNLQLSRVPKPTAVA